MATQAESMASMQPPREWQLQQEHAAANWDAHLLTMHAGTLANKQKLFQSENVGNVVELLKSLAEDLKKTGPQHDAKVAQLREMLKQLLTVSSEVGAHAAALTAVQGTLQPTATPTDFKTLLAKQTQEHMEAAAYDLDRAPELRDFDKCVGNAPEADEDEDVAIEGQDGDVAPNAACPISGQGIWDIETPVQDQLGIVYDKASVEAFIRQQRGRVQCPLHGTSHEIALNTLKPANRLMREQRRRQRRRERQSQNPNASAGDGVLDID